MRVVAEASEPEEDEEEEKKDKKKEEEEDPEQRTGRVHVQAEARQEGKKREDAAGVATRPIAKGPGTTLL